MERPSEISPGAVFVVNAVRRVWWARPGARPAGGQPSREDSAGEHLKDVRVFQGGDGVRFADEPLLEGHEGGDFRSQEFFNAL
jgi:hypothetical protein